MNRRIQKWINRILVVLIVLAAGFILYSVTIYKQDFPDYSTYNSTGTGIKALYLLTEKMGWQVQRYHYPARFLQDQSVMAFYRPSPELFNDEREREDLKAWLMNGNTMLLIPGEENLNQLWIFKTISEMKKWHEVVNIGDITVTYYGLETGLICVMDRPGDFLNENLAHSGAAVAFIRTLERIDNSRISFNEYYQFLQKPAPGVWELIGTTGQIVAVQLLLVLLLLFVRGWRPFGRVRNELEWSKRPENETLKALSGVYRRMSAHPLVLSNYYGYFTQKYSRFLSTPSPLQERAMRVLSACSSYMDENRKSKKELTQLVHQLEKLEKAINGR